MENVRSILKKLNKKENNYFNPNFKNPLKKFYIYRRLGLIDSGTYGKVFKVKKPNLNKLYACKEVKLLEKKSFKFHSAS